jgi:hypothetical protein
MFRKELRSFRLKAEATDAVEAIDRLLAEADERLREAMSVQPSPEFGRKVRERIVQQRREPAWPVWRWAAAAACVLAVAIGWRAVHTAREEGPSESARMRIGTDVRLAAQKDAPVIPIRRHPPLPANRPPTLAEPEIIVPEENARAVARLLALARSGRVDEERLTPIASAAKITGGDSLDISPISVAPIPVPDIETDSVAPSGDGRQE